MSISEHGDGVAWLRKSAVLLLSPRRKSPFISTELPELVVDKIVSIPKLDPLDPSIVQEKDDHLSRLHNNFPVKFRKRRKKN